MPVRKPWGFKHFANLGDIMAAMPSMKSFYQNTKRKAILYQQLNVEGHYFQGAKHPTVDENGMQVMCNQTMFDMIRPLVIAQEYIHDMQVYKGQSINVNFDTIRSEVNVNMPYGAIQQWLFIAYPDLAYDLSKAWIEVGEVDISDCGILHNGLVTAMLPIENIESKIIVNFTERYRNAAISYYFLKNAQSFLLFAGTKNEHELFCKAWDIDIPRLHINNFLQLAYIIKKAKFLLSNQSFLWNLAEAMKTPRLLEYCAHAPNCQSFIGEHSYAYYKQAGVEYYFRLLFNKK